MATVKFGALVTDIRGKLGGHVFQGNGFTTSLRTGHSGNGGIDARDAIYQTMNKSISDDYDALSQADKDAWQNLAQQYPIQDNFGNQNFLTGRNLYTRNNTAFRTSGQTGTINPALAIGDLPSSSLEHMQFRWAAQELDLQFIDDRFSEAIIIYARPVLKFGLAIDPSKLPFLYGEHDQEPNDSDLWDAFFLKYPDFMSGDPCQFGVVQVNEFGFKTFSKTIYGTFVP